MLYYSQMFFPSNLHDSGKADNSHTLKGLESGDTEMIGRVIIDMIDTSQY